MAEYVLYGVLHAQRNFGFYAEAQRNQIWAHDAGTTHAYAFNVSILGLGQLGATVAQRLVTNGYAVSGWSRTPKAIADVTTYTGEAGLKAMLAQCKVLVCLLPLTKDTHHILNASLFELAPQGLFLINLSRGSHLKDEDLLAGLAGGQISGALLDVTEPEPLPKSHAFWSEPRIVLTPHIAGPTQEMESAQQIVDNIHNFRAGRQMSGLVNRKLGF